MAGREGMEGMEGIEEPERRWVDLASARLGGRALLANDEFFAPKENLLEEAPAEFREGEYTDRGKWMDGWETRRRREPGHDWCIVRLGLPGTIRRVTVDTSHFRGNHPEACTVEACEAAPDADPRTLVGPGSPWVVVVPRSPLAGHAENAFPVDDERRFTHVRLNIHPDGGIARLRVRGEVRPDWDRILAGGGTVDLASVVHGGTPLGCSDRFFSEPFNLIRPDRPENMGDGWETRRRRGPGHDWVVLRLGRRGTVEEVVVDTTHFKGNYPESCRVEGCDAPDVVAADVLGDGVAWRQLLPRTRLGPDERRAFRGELADAGPFTHARLSIFPDGGVARLRIRGRPDPWRAAGRGPR